MAASEGAGDALYREVVLEHARHPRNAEPVTPHTHLGEAFNPLCGDQLEVSLCVEAGAIGAIGARVRGCAIAQAGASLMTEAIKGRTLDEAGELGAAFRAALEAPPDREAAAVGLPPALEALTPLLAVRRHRSRIRCALLAWEALDALREGTGEAGT